jgi:hypothetical protein
MRCSDRTLSASVLCSVWDFLTLTYWLIAHWSVFLGSFVAIYRILLNAFPLLFPANVPMPLNLRNLTKNICSSSEFDLADSTLDDSSPLIYDSPIEITPAKEKGEVRLSSVARAHQTWLHQRSARWHSIVAGAVAGGISISLENPSRRKVIAQQLFVRQVPLLCNLSYS